MKFFATLLFLMLCISSSEIFAQPGAPPDPDVPISGIEWLLVGGGVFGCKALMKRFRRL